MKKLSKRTRIIGISILSVLVLSFGTMIALFMQSYDDPIIQEPEIQPLGNYDYSKRPFFASSNPTVYKGDIYCKDPGNWLSHISLSDLFCDFRDKKYADPQAVSFPRYLSICQDESHDHGANEKPEGECLDYKVGQFLIDAYESNGGSPIIYRTHIMERVNSVEDEYGIITRYDTGSMTAEKIVSVSDAIGNVMTYDQFVFFTTYSAQGKYSIHVVSKKGGEIKSLELGNYKHSLIWANDNYVYYQDSAGNIFRVGHNLENPEFIFYAESISAMNPEHQGTFIYGEYIYYESDYETVPYSMSIDGSLMINFAKHTIRRVPLENPQGESELVAENVLDNYIYGVGNNVLYYQPCIMADNVQEPGKEYYFNFTGGQLIGINLDTLEQAQIVNDVGLDILGNDSYTLGNMLLVHAFPTDGRYHRDRWEGWGMIYFILVPSTGALYPLGVNLISDWG